MKFPLSPRPFAPIELNRADERALAELSDAFIDETLTHYESFLLHDGGVVHSSQWKVVKAREDVTVYRHAKLPDGGVEAADAKNDRLQVMLGCGVVPGTLDDLMFGVVNASRDNMMLRSSYINDKIVDCAVLASIAAPTAKDPMRSLQVKWSVNAPPSAVRKLVRPRDFVYLEATGMAQLPSTGERVGYHVLHSIDVPGVHELHEHGIVRGNLSIYHVYRQKVDPVSGKAGEVEMYVRGFCDPKGEMRASVAAYTTAGGLISIRKNMLCAQMKKLAWLYRHRTRSISTESQQKVDRFSESECAVCHKSFMSMSMLMRRSTGLRTNKRCHICRALVCSSCRSTHKLSFFEPSGHRVVSKRARFCKCCLAEGLQLSGLELAADELVRESRHEYPDTMSSSMRSLSLSLSLGSSPSAKMDTESEIELEMDTESEFDTSRSRQLDVTLEDEERIVV